MHYIAHLQKDGKLKKVLSTQDPIVLKFEKDLVYYLCASIIGQQLSTKVADVIRERFFALLDKRKDLAKQILNLDIDTIRSAGLSLSKANYIKNLAEFSIQNKQDFATIHLMDDENAIHFLTQIKGIGQWTVEMLLMFALGREDVFPLDDLGIQQDMIKLYNIESDSKKILKIEMKKIASKWAPFRTYACLHLWRWKDA